MSPETAIDRVRSFIRWNSEKLERLDAPHEAIANPLGWRRGAEYCLPPRTWREIFENDEEAALTGGQALRDNGLLRLPAANSSFQFNVKIRGEVKACYCISEKILTWNPEGGDERRRRRSPAAQKLGNELNNEYRRLQSTGITL
jgi:hypothetical protein